MIEIDHTAAPAPEPSRPILASHLLVVEENQRKKFVERGGERIKTGCEEIDGYVLEGGFERGIVVGISADGDEGRLISLNLLASVLLSHLSSTTTLPNAKSKATIVDTNGSFSIPLLASIIKSRIISNHELLVRNQATTSNYAGSKVEDEALDGEVQRCLEMVAISRVFDLEGLWEVLGEIGRGSATDGEPLQDGLREDAIRNASPSPGQHVGDAEPLEKEVAETGKEEGILVDSDSNASPVQDTANMPSPHAASKEGPSDEGTEIIIIDNMAHTINELFSRKEKGEAHLLLTTLSRSLHSLTHTLNILTLLHNTTISSKPSYANPTHPSYRKPHHLTNQNTPSISSVFAANPLKPALGRIFDQFPELHLLLTRMPKTRDDAELLYAQDDEASPNPFDQLREAGYCLVCEVVKDEVPDLGTTGNAGRKRFGEREQRWAALEVGSGGVQLVSAFMERGTMRGLGLERERARAHDVGGVARIYGFGGRRV